jgi:hypothetical protein
MNQEMQTTDPCKMLKNKINKAHTNNRRKGVEKRQAIWISDEKCAQFQKPVESRKFVTTFKKPNCKKGFVNKAKEEGYRKVSF